MFLRLINNTELTLRKMDKTILLQKQVRDNSEDLRTYLNDLIEWEDEMKRKESEISGGSGEPAVPIPRNKAKKIEDKSSKKNDTEKEKIKKIKSYDYAAWEKFDVDAECDKVDKVEEEEAESEEEDPSEEYKTRLRDEANYEKERGNQFVKNKKWDEAISCYTHSIGCYAKDPIYFANRALCFLKTDDLHSAEADCTSALQLDPTYVKALQRRAAAREGLKQIKEAAADLKRVLEIEPQNKESKQLLDKIEKRLGIKKDVQKPVDLPKPSISKVSNVQDNLTAVTTKKEENKEQQPKPVVPKLIPWPDRPSSEIILPVNKLPHQRSKKPLRRIQIQESNSSEIQVTSKKKEENTENTILNIDYNESNALAKILAQSSSIDVDEILNNIEKEVKVNETNESSVKTAEKPHVKTIEIEKAEIYDLPIPKTSVQFYSSWKSMKNSNKSKYVYLKNIIPTEIPNIFKDSLESDVLSDIIFILNEYFIANKLPIFQYLTSLSNVRRFSALTMFMSSNDKIVLKKLFEYCENSSESTKEDIDLLLRKYEL